MPAISSSLGKAWLAVMLFLSMAPTMAQVVNEDASGIRDCKAHEVIKFRGGTAELENDLFADTDQNYSSGVAITAVSQDIVGKLKPECLPTPVRLQAELIMLLNPGFWTDAENPAHTQNVVVKMGQSMFTPKDFARTDLILDDRPYAGLLYVGMSWNRRKHEPQGNLEVLDTREITLGVMGPWALGEQAQNLIHDLIGVDRFLGWQNQLKNEPALQLAIDRKFRDYRGMGAIVPGFSVDSIRSLGLRLGNIETSASVGIEGRIGWNLPNDFGTYPIRPGAENRPHRLRPSTATQAMPLLQPSDHDLGYTSLARSNQSCSCTTSRSMATCSEPAIVSRADPGLPRPPSGSVPRVWWPGTASSWP